MPVRWVNYLLGGFLLLLAAGSASAQVRELVLTEIWQLGGFYETVATVDMDRDGFDEVLVGYKGRFMIINPQDNDTLLTRVNLSMDRVLCARAFDRDRDGDIDILIGGSDAGKKAILQAFDGPGYAAGPVMDYSGPERFWEVKSMEIDTTGVRNYIYLGLSSNPHQAVIGGAIRKARAANPGNYRDLWLGEPSGGLVFVDSARAGLGRVFAGGYSYREVMLGEFILSLQFLIADENLSVVKADTLIKYYGLDAGDLGVIGIVSGDGDGDGDPEVAMAFNLGAPDIEPDRLAIFHAERGGPSFRGKLQTPIGQVLQLYGLTYIDEDRDGREEIILYCQFTETGEYRFLSLDGAGGQLKAASRNFPAVSSLRKIMTGRWVGSNRQLLVVENRGIHIYTVN